MFCAVSLVVEYFSILLYFSFFDDNNPLVGIVSQVVGGNAVISFFFKFYDNVGNI